MTEDLIIGIDLGTTHSLVGVVDSGFPIILADENGDRLLPSAISYGEGQHPLIGKNALRNLTLSPDKTLLSIKRLIGRNYSQLTREEIDESDIPLERGENDSILLRVDKDTAVTPVSMLVARSSMKDLTKRPKGKATPGASARLKKELKGMHGMSKRAGWRVLP